MLFFLCLRVSNSVPCQFSNMYTVSNAIPYYFFYVYVFLILYHANFLICTLFLMLYHTIFLIFLVFLILYHANFLIYLLFCYLKCYWLVLMYIVAFIQLCTTIRMVNLALIYKRDLLLEKYTRQYLFNRFNGLCTRKPFDKLTVNNFSKRKGVAFRAIT